MRGGNEPDIVHAQGFEDVLLVAGRDALYSGISVSRGAGADSACRRRRDWSGRHGCCAICVVLAPSLPLHAASGDWGGERGILDLPFYHAVYYNSSIYPMGPPSYVISPGRQDVCCGGWYAALADYEPWTRGKSTLVYDFVDTATRAWTSAEDRQPGSA